MIDYEAAARTAPSVGNLPFLEKDCDHKVVIVESKNQVGQKGNRYIIKVRVLASTATGQTPAPQPGADRCVIINLDPPRDRTKPDYGMQNLMNYANGLNGGPVANPESLKKLLGAMKVTPEDAQRYRIPACDEIKALAIGMVVGDRAVGGMTAGVNGQPGHEITYHNWYPIKQTAEQVVERRNALASGGTITL